MKKLAPYLAPLALALLILGGSLGLSHWARVAQADDTPRVDLALLDAGLGDAAAAASAQPAADVPVADAPVVILPATPASPCLDPDGPTGLAPCGPIPSIFEQPRETWTAARYYWQVGGWPFTVFVLLVVASVAQLHLRPRDKDGDGDPDPEGWRGWAWVASGAVLMVGAPVLAWLLRRVGIDTGTAGSVEAIAVATVGAVGLIINLQRGRAPAKAVG